ncbi:MAG: hypothetical protein ACJAZ2_001647, partial [Glaciecola sp.]
MKLDLKTLYYILFSFLFCCSTTLLKAETMYWVGGEGTWSDVNHWSKTSGGVGGELCPGLEDDVVINDDSFDKEGSVHCSGNAIMKSFSLNAEMVSVVLNSDSSAFFVVSRHFFMTEKHSNDFIGAAYFLNDHADIQPQRFEPFEFIGLKGNSKDVSEIKDETLAITSLTATPADQTCAGDCDGSITANVVGGAGPFFYEWFLGATPHSNGINLNVINGLCAGAYLVIVTDLSDNDRKDVTVNIGPTFGVSLLALPPTCPGGTDGSVSAFPFGGAAPLKYLWNNTQTTPSITGLTPATYSVVVTDDNGCATGGTKEVVDTLPPIVITPLAVNIPKCGTEGCTEDVTFTAVGGNGPPPVTGFLISGINPPSEAPVILNDICPGASFEVFTEDSKGCPQTLTHTAAIIPPIVIATTELDTVTCLGVSDGAASASASGGLAPYVYNWTDIPAGAVVNATGDTVTSLPAGTYNVEVTDSNDCVQQASVTVTSPTPQVVTAGASVSSIVTCIQASNGEVTATGTGGDPGPGYLFNWYSILPVSPSTAVVDSLPEGTYFVEVKDVDGCVDTAQVDVTAPVVSPVVAGASVSSVITCVIASNGEVTATGTGGGGG